MVREVMDAHVALRQSEHPTPIPDPTHDIVAVDAEGNVLYETECAWGIEDARAARDSCNEHHEEHGLPENHDVHHFEIRHRDGSSTQGLNCPDMKYNR